jgi:hypothetical protein
MDLDGDLRGLLYGFLKRDMGEYLYEDLGEGAQRDVDALFVWILERDMSGLFDVHLNGLLMYENSDMNLLIWVRSLMRTC